jgi:hypothetical protein
MTVSPPPSGEVLPISKMRQWAVLPDGMLLSTRAPDGSWLPVRRLGYDDLRMVYRFEVVDWSPVGWASLIWLFLGTLTLIGLLLLKVPAEWAFVAVFLELVALIGGAVYRCQTKKKSMLRFEAYSGELVLPESNPLFFTSVSEALASAETWRHAAAPAPEAVGYPGATPESGQPQWQPYAGLPPLWNPPTPPQPQQATYAAPPPEWQTPAPPPPPVYSAPTSPGVEEPSTSPPSYTAPSSQSAENPPSPLPAPDNSEATGENERR